ncbi:MAG TPA: MaoC/PaaZ C-terminal domain-containing protein [Spirochaetota bacterium]|nr:MaoC/PaaZ C-terminal domain-containing protein [Spirochaetota bacterium]
MDNHNIYDRIPGVFSSCMKIIFLRRSGVQPGSELPRIKVSIDNVTIDENHLKEYMELCGLRNDGTLPILYPHVFTAPLQMAVVSHKNFPVSCLGILHYRNHIISHRAINADEKLSIKIELVESRIVKQGAEFDYTIQVRSEGEMVWESITTYLKKGKFGAEYHPSPNGNLIQAEPEMERYAEFFIPGDIGNRYARICSDYNPIHLSKTVARLFGYKKKVAHAMWAAACSIGRLPGINLDNPVRVDLAFKGPLFTGSKSYITAFDGGDYSRFDYYCGDNPRAVINGKISAVEKGYRLI